MDKDSERIPWTTVQRGAKLSALQAIHRFVCVCVLLCYIGGATLSELQAIHRRHSAHSLDSYVCGCTQLSSRQWMLTSIHAEQIDGVTANLLCRKRFAPTTPALPTHRRGHAPPSLYR